VVIRMFAVAAIVWAAWVGAGWVVDGVAGGVMW